MNHLTLTLKVEEPAVTTIAIRPGVVDTGMQQAIREEHKGVMDTKDAQKFSELHSGGNLLKPEQPGNVCCRLVLGAPMEMSGKFYRYVVTVRNLNSIEVIVIFVFDNANN